MPSWKFFVFILPVALWMVLMGILIKDPEKFVTELQKAAVIGGEHSFAAYMFFAVEGVLSFHDTYAPMIVFLAKSLGGVSGMSLEFIIDFAKRPENLFSAAGAMLLTGFLFV